MDRFLQKSVRKQSNDGKSVASCSKRCIASEDSSNNKKPRNRKYDPKYLEYGFTWAGSEEAPRPQCVVCGEVLAKESLKPSKMIRHLQTKHSSLQTKPLDYFKRKLRELRGQKNVLKGAVTVNEKALEASFVVSYWIAKTGKPHNIGESFFLPCAKEMVCIMLGENAATQLDLIPLSNDTIARRIHSMARDVTEQVTNMVKQSAFFAIQIDETTDVSGSAQMLTYIKFENNENLHEEFFFCQPLPQRATGEQLFSLLDTFVTDSGLEWLRCVGICSDGARAMTGKNSGLVTRVQAVAPQAVWTHCIIHRQALVAKKMPPILKQVLDEAVRTVNVIKSSATSARLFRVLCEEMGAEHHQLLYHTEVRWLSRGKVVNRLFELRDEVHFFLSDRDSMLAEKFLDAKWLALLAYLADIFDRLNVLNTSLQGQEMTVFSYTDKIESWIKKLSLWYTRVESGNFEAFPLLDDFLHDNDLPKHDLKPVIISHLESLQQQFRQYFPEKDRKAEAWIRNPFSAEATANACLPLSVAEKLIDLSCDETLKLRYSEQPLANFWISVQQEYPDLSSAALKVLTPFTSTYLCEAGFSALTLLKNRYRSRLAVEDDIRLYLSHTKPRFKNLCSTLQAHPSH
ncbi:zinc finger BED domain-containing protein 5-like [Pseudophryne corroboree]|uniref:zinc finger BED domain-containing protein 5-like n=1 Tax=Pseudophryne corroboree TaxID=495146 RepID=UPI0030814E8C